MMVVYEIITVPHHGFLQDGNSKVPPGTISYTSWKAVPLTGNAPEAKPREEEDGEKAKFYYRDMAWLSFQRG